MNQSYFDFKKITDQYYTDWEMPNFEVFENLLLKYNIRLRQSGDLSYAATFSVPKSIPNALVLGIRYVKRQNGIYTEDLYLFQEGKEIVCGYRGSLEETVLPEYRGTHRLQIC